MRINESLRDHGDIQGYGLNCTLPNQQSFERETTKRQAQTTKTSTRPGRQTTGGEDAAAEREAASESFWADYG